MSRSRKLDRIRPLDVALRRAAEADRRLRQAFADRFGVGASDLDALALLDDGGALAAGRIAEALAVTTGAVTGLIDRLERQGWVQRTRHEADRRQVLVEVAAGKREQLAELRAAREQAIAAATGEIDDAGLAEAAQMIAAAAEQLEVAAHALAAPAAPDADADAGDRAPIGAIEHATLRFASGVARLELRGARIRDLYRATFAGPRPVITVEPGGVVALQYKGLSWWRGRSATAELALTTAVPWSIEISRGASHLRADLRELEVRAVEITGGASECDLRLPRPRGTATVRIRGGASHVTVRRPRGVAVQAMVKGGANSLEVDDQTVGAIGSTARLVTPGWDAAADRWSIELTGGASHLAVSAE
jgi:DNA-binding MarR family transcriptional regulator